MKNNELIIAAVPVTLVQVIYPMCVDHIQKVVDKAPTDISVDTILDGLLSGDRMLVTISDGPEIIAVNVLQLEVMETGYRVLYIPITGGERMDEWLERFLSFAANVGRDLKCEELRGLACRKGWLRALNKTEQEWYPIHEVIGCKIIPLQEESE